MSVIYGICRSPNSVVNENTLLCLGGFTARYGPDDTKAFSQGRIGMAFQAFHTHHRSRFERQPTVDGLGNVAVLDGRLDNYRELTATVGLKEEGVSDSFLILKSFARWGQDCFSHFVGDWAIALWSTKDHILYLARDHAGTRNLFYRNVNGEITWSTYLETFFADHTHPEPDGEYVARSLSYQKIGDLTPYKGIRAVPPAHFVAIREGKEITRPHWHWIAHDQIIHRSLAEYDEHFLHLLKQAVARRHDPQSSTLAELSGGMDSSAIVCVSDAVLSGGGGRLDRLDTVSYYDDTEPDWNERPYFTTVENVRHKNGIHIDCSSRVPSYEPLIVTDRIYPYPCGDRLFLDFAAQFEETVGVGRYRVILSGLGGDELLGGVPTPMPELADHLRQGRLTTLISRASSWCIANRQPLLHMLYGSVSYTAGLYRTPRVREDALPPWLSPDLRKLCSRPRSYPESKRDLVAARPSAIGNGRSWWAIHETLPHRLPRVLGCYEYRYPYLDRHLVEFIHRVPRELLVEPGRRRVLMRRSLRGIVPTEILERKRKAFVSRGPISHIRSAREKIERLFQNPLLAEHGLIDRNQFLQAFSAELTGDVKWIGHLSKTIEMELWLRSLSAQSARLCVATIDRQNVREVLPADRRANDIRVRTGT